MEKEEEAMVEARDVAERVEADKGVERAVMRVEVTGVVLEVVEKAEAEKGAGRVVVREEE